MRLLAFVALVFPSIALGACPEPNGNAAFTLFDGPYPTTVYRGADGITVLNGQRDGGVIHAVEMYRGLFMLASPDGVGGTYLFEYGAPLDPVFAFNAGDRFEIPTTLLYNGEIFSSTWTYEIMGEATVTIGECAYDTVVIDRTEGFEDQSGSTSTVYYAPALGVVIQRDFDHDFDPDTPPRTTTTDRVSDDPSTFVPR